MTARVMIDTPLPQLDRLFDYAIPDSMLAELVPGVRVRVPLRSAGRVADGFVIEVTDDAEFVGELSDIESLVSPVPVLTGGVWTLARRVADRAAGSASDVVRLAVPKRQVRVEKAWHAADRADPADLAHIATPAGYNADRVRKALATGERLAVDAVPRVVQIPDGSWVGRWATTMAAAAAMTVESGSSAILAVPDYRDQVQLIAALSAVLPPSRIVHLDARQSGPERYRGFLACLGDDPLVIVGNRSVVYAPARQLGLIAVWDDGDPMHAEPLAPYVHARDAALVRQELQACSLWFVGHSRSTEVERLVEIGFVGRLAPERGHSPRIVPTAHQAPQDRFAAIARIPSAAWREASRVLESSALDSGPVLVQVARPGYAPRLACSSCGDSARCARCDGPLATRTARSTPACRWCGALAIDWQCASCGGHVMRLVGQGATRTAEDLGRAFPGVRILVADGEKPVLTVDAAPALVIATRGAEPVAAGGYRAVLLLDGERMLARESLRVGEDCLRWWANAAALAAPGAPVLLVGVGGALAAALATWRLPAYASAELADRRRLRFPPAIRVATVTGTADDVARAIASVQAIAGTDVLGPVEIAPRAGAAALGPVTGDGVRAIVRFDYAEGAAVASALRAEIVRAATARRRRLGGKGQVPLPTLKVRFDDLEPFAE